MELYAYYCYQSTTITTISQRCHSTKGLLRRPSTSRTQSPGHVLRSGALLSYFRIVEYYRYNATDYVPVPMLARWIRRSPMVLDSSTADQHFSGPIHTLLVSSPDFLNAFQSCRYSPHFTQWTPVTPSIYDALSLYT